MDPYILIPWIHILLLCGPAKWLAMIPHTNFYRIHILRFSGPTIIFVVIVEPHEQRQHDRLAPDHSGGRR